MVVFRANGGIVATIPLVNGTAVLKISPLGPGTSQIMTAEYLGSSTQFGSTSRAGQFLVSQSASTVTLALSLTPNRAAVRLIATMTTAASGLIPTGKVTFSFGRYTRTLRLGAGQASLNVARSYVMGRYIQVQYNGDANFLPSRSETIRNTRAAYSAVPATRAADSIAKAGVQSLVHSMANSITHLFGKARHHSR